MARLFTVQDVSEEIEMGLAAKARAQGKSMNDLAVEALAVAAGVKLDGIKKRDLSDIVGTWVEDPEFDQIMREQDQIDPEMWK